MRWYALCFRPDINLENEEQLVTGRLLGAVLQ